MSKTTHAAVRAPQQAEKPKATLSQLGELVALMDGGKIERDYMQDFLRRRMMRPSEVPTQQPAAENALLKKVEETARKYYPHAINEILEVVVPFCDSHLDLEFKLFKESYDAEPRTIGEIMFWLPVKQVEVLLLGKGFQSLSTGEIPGGNGEPFGNHTAKIFADVFKTYHHLDSGFDKGATEIVHDMIEKRLDTSLYDHIRKRLNATGAVRYGLIKPNQTEHGGILHSIVGALERAIVLAAKGDMPRLKRVVAFLDYQHSGRPICHWNNGTAFLLGVKPFTMTLGER